MLTGFCGKRFVYPVIIAALIALSVSDSVKAEDVTNDDKHHIVLSGDNLEKISDRYGVSIGAIALANGLTSTKILVGQQLVMPDIDAPVNPTPIDHDVYTTITYVVRPGDTLGAIAQNYGSAVDKIVDASGLISTSILVDQFLTIPAEMSLEGSDDTQELDDDIVSEETDDDLKRDHTSSAVITDRLVLTDEEGQRQELHSAGYDYAFSASTDDIKRIYEYGFNGSNDTPVDVVVNYWNYVSQGNYDLSWELLSRGFRNRVHGGKFESYVQGYHDMDLCSVSADDVENIDDSSLDTIVTASVTYRSGPDCSSLQVNMILSLQYRDLVGVWDIDSVNVSLEEQGSKLDVGEAYGERGWIDIDISDQRAYAMKGEEQIREFVVSTGTDRYPTITGQFQIYVKHLEADMRGVDLGVPWYLPDVPYVMYFYSGYGIHGTYWHDNFGTPMSHGCINLTIPDAEWLYNFSEIGTPVRIHY
tara:strand:+ start:78514 stop:79935 length:1422 start_codon:yes stop_codon:yes gene_type:complete